MKIPKPQTPNPKQFPISNPQCLDPCGNNGESLLGTSENLVLVGTRGLACPKSSTDEPAARPYLSDRRVFGGALLLMPGSLVVGAWSFFGVCPPAVADEISTAPILSGRVLAHAGGPCGLAESLGFGVFSPS